MVLADEINRAPAKVQSALLEAMEERQVTIGETSLPLPRPFFVLATQNPIEQEGTYPLPEAQVDRFMLKVVIDYPAGPTSWRPRPHGRAEREHRHRPGAGGRATWRSCVRRWTRYMSIAKVKEYIVDVVRATRTPAEYGLDLGGLIQLGASTAGDDRPAPGGEGPRLPGRPRVRDPGGREGDGPGRAPPPAGDLVRGRGRGPAPGSAGQAGAGPPAGAVTVPRAATPEDAAWSVSACSKFSSTSRFLKGWRLPAGRHPGLRVRGDAVRHLRLRRRGGAPRRAGRSGCPPERIQDMAIWLFVSGIIGARVLYMIQYADQFPDKSIGGLFGAFFQIWKGGIIFYGSALGGTIGYGLFYWFVLRS